MVSSSRSQTNNHIALLCLRCRSKAISGRKHSCRLSCSRSSSHAPPTLPRMPGQRAAIPTPSRGSFCAVVEGHDGRRERAIDSRVALS